MDVLYAGAAGFVLSLGLILAIGPQNVFVLRQGLMRSHVFAVCLTCSLCDALFIVVGVAGVGAALQEATWLERPMALGAALFIVGYGALRFRSALRPSVLAVDDTELTPLWSTISAALGFTFLNPHVYLDTLLLIGGASTRFTGDALLAFTGGAIVASFLFFFSLGFGARRLSSWLSTPRAWQRIDVAIGSSMLVLGFAVAWPHLVA